MNVPKLSDVERYPGQRNRNDALEIPRNFDFDADDPGRRYTFKYYSGDEGDDDNGELEWQEVLSCFRCEHRSMQAIQCRRRSCLTLPRCWQHLKLDYNSFKKPTVNGTVVNVVTGNYPSVVSHYKIGDTSSTVVLKCLTCTSSTNASLIQTASDIEFVIYSGEGSTVWN